MITEKLIPHPYAACYPLVSGALEHSLLESIRENGLRQPIVLWRDELRTKVWIIDGRNRYRALEQLQGGVTEEQVIWRDYTNDEDVRLAVLDYNENRRQMSTAQKSIVAGKILEARAHLLSHLEVSEHTSSDTSADTNLSTLQTREAEAEAEAESESEMTSSTLQTSPVLQEDLKPVSSTVKIQAHLESEMLRKTVQASPKVNKEVAQTLGIGARTAQKGATIVGRGAPKLVAALEQGAVSLEAAYTLTQLDDRVLDEVIAQGKEVMRDKARELKGIAKESRDALRRNALFGDLEINLIELQWIERNQDQERQIQLKITDSDQLYQVLSTLQKLGLMTPQDAKEDHDV